MVFVTSDTNNTRFDIFSNAGLLGSGSHLVRHKKSLNAASIFCEFTAVVCGGGKKNAALGCHGQPEPELKIAYQDTRHCGGWRMDAAGFVGKLALLILGLIGLDPAVPSPVLGKQKTRGFSLV